MRRSFLQFLFENFSPRQKEFARQHQVVKDEYGNILRYTERIVPAGKGRKVPSFDYIGKDKIHGYELVKKAEDVVNQFKYGRYTDADPKEYDDNGNDVAKKNDDNGKDISTKNDDNGNVVKRNKRGANSDGAKYEQKVADVVNTWIKNDDDGKQNTRISDVTSNDEDKFKAVRSGLGSKKSDVDVIHDKEGGNQKEFFIEAKLGQGQGFNPTMEIRQTDDGFEFVFVGSQIPDDTQNQSDTSEQYDYSKMMGKTDLGRIMAKALNISNNKFLQTITNVLDAFYEISQISDAKTSLVNKPKEKYVFPRDFDRFPPIFDYIIKYTLKPKPMSEWNKLDKIINEYGISKKYIVDTFLNGDDDQEKYEDLLNSNTRGKTDCLYRLFSGNQLRFLNDVRFEKNGKIKYLKPPKEKTYDFDIVVSEGEQEFLEEDDSMKDEVHAIVDDAIYAIKSWYCDHKNVAYITYKNQEGEDSSKNGVYIFDTNFDPLNLQEKIPGIMTFQDGVQGLRLSCDRSKMDGSKENNKISFQIKAKIEMNYNGLRIEDIFNNDLVMKKGDEKNDRSNFFKENEK